MVIPSRSNQAGRYKANRDIEADRGLRLAKTRLATRPRFPGDGGFADLKGGSGRAGPAA
jgi:hypothetical protein